MLSQIFNWFENASFVQLAFVSIVILFVIWYVFVDRRKRKVSPQVFPGGISRPEPATGKVSPVERKDLLDVATTQPIVLQGPSGPQIGFPTSPIMPHLNVIDGVSPYNPDFAGKEWADTGGVTPGSLEVPAMGASV